MAILGYLVRGTLLANDIGVRCLACRAKVYVMVGDTL
jgi:hypothetical protein